jgi:hypothetical protein
MTFFKYFVPILGLLLAGSSGGRAADDGAATGATTASSGTSSTHPAHHRKHHAKNSSADTNAAPATTGAVAQTTPAKTEDSTAEASSARKSGASHAESPAPTAGGAGPVPAVPPATASTAGAAAPAAPSGTHHHRHHDATGTAGTTNANAAPALAGAGSPTKPPATGAAAAPAPAPAAGLAAAKPASQTAAATATTGKRHRRHGTTAAAKPLPEPIIVVPETHPSVTPQPPATTTATLPTSPPISDNRTPASVVPVVQTGLPVARPGSGNTATLPIAPVRPPLPALINFPFKDYPQQKRTRTYPWKMGIVTTVFWIGEGSTPLSGATNRVSAWDMNWVHNNGGADDQNDMSGYASREHASTLNPFYVALPFNDLAYPDKTARWLPAGWYKPYHHGEKPVSACKDRWVEIKNRAGRYCFAQWEDVGPVVTDDAEYVFGSEPPSAIQGRGLDVSPAVAKYLGIESTARTSWRFVDDGDVLPGMWLRYDEQALLFRAIREGLHGSPSPRIQDLNEPMPDPDDSSQKKAGAARG